MSALASATRLCLAKIILIVYLGSYADEVVYIYPDFNANMHNEQVSLDFGLLIYISIHYMLDRPQETTSSNAL